MTALAVELLVCLDNMYVSGLAMIHNKSAIHCIVAGRADWSFVTGYRKRGHFTQKLKMELLIPRYSSLP